MKAPTAAGIVAIGLASTLPLFAQDGESTEPEAAAPAAEAPDAATVKSDSSYGLGFRTGGEFGQRYGSFGVTPDDIEVETFIKGFLDGFKGGEPQLSEEKVGAAMQALGDMLQEREKQVAEKNLEAGKAFLEENRKKEGVTTLESGLQYEVITKGEGETYKEPKEGEPGKQFQVNYRGTLLDGTEFDASPEGEPVTMSLEVIDGFKEALTSMPVGSKWRLFIPSGLAYGEQRRSPEIGPNSALIFELELVAIEDAPAHPGGLPFPMPQPGAQPGE